MTSESDGAANKLGLDSPTTKSRPVRVTRSYLSMASAELLTPGAPPVKAATLVLLEACPVPTWRALYAQIGGPWHWHDRDAWSDARLDAHLASPDVRIYRADATLNEARDAREMLVDKPLIGAGFIELERHTDGSVEISYLGLDRRAFGFGLGRWIVAEATKESWAMGATKVWLHSCTLDGPVALSNYLARGFTRDRVEEYDTVIHESLGAD